MIAEIKKHFSPMESISKEMHNFMDICSIDGPKKAQNRGFASALCFYSYYQCFFVAISTRSFALKSSRDITPPSPSLRARTETVPASCSSAPTITM